MGTETTNPKKALKYSEDEISGFTRDLEKIQAKPTLYIGPTDDAGVFTLLRECLDNAVDEARAGRNDKIHIYIEGPRGPFWILDNGVGIPVGIHKKMKISTLTHVLTNLQSSGKMQAGVAYKSAVGTHGVGIKATNALSSTFEVWTHRADSGGWHYTRFAKGVEKVAVKKCKPSDAPIFANAKIPVKKGTLIKFEPDPKFFGKSKISLPAVVQWARMTSYMNPGLNITLHAGGKSKTWASKDGIRDYLSARIEKLNATLFSKKTVFHNSPTMEMILAFSDVEGSQVEFFTNTVRNVEEGVHADDVYKALFDSLKPHLKVKESKPKKAKVRKTRKKASGSKYPFTPSDLRDGLIGLVNYKIDAPQFDSQTKEKLVDGRVKGVCYTEAMSVFSAFWEQNPKLAKDLIQRASLLRAKTADFLKDKKLLKNVGAAKKAVSTKLAPVLGKVPVEQRELFIVEGDSAGGGAKRARNKTFQAIYPMKGKPLNVIDAKQDKINNNAEVTGLLAAIGADEKGKGGKPSLSYGKVIIMADPDVDGSHITCLINATLWKYRPDLYKDGHVFVVKSPLYIAKKGGKVFFGDTKEEIYKKAGTKTIDITYIKGWGEINEGDLDIALNPSVRTLYRVGPPDKSGVFEAILGSKPDARKKLLGVT
jgi:DNA gyrase subunit B